MYFENCRAIIPYLEKKEEPLSRLYNNLGSFYTNRKDFAQGIQYHEQAINLRIGLFTENHYLVARSYANLSGTYMEIGNLPKALSLAQKSLDIKLHVPQMDSSEIGASFITLGDIYTLLDDSARGMRNFQQAERIFMAQYGESHPYTGEVRNSMAAGFIQMGRPIDAMAYYQKALASYTAVNGSAAPDVQRVRISMALLYQSMGNLPSAVRLLDTVLTDIGWPSKRDNIHPDQCFNLFETLLFKGEMLSLMATSFAQRAEALKLLHQAVEWAERYRDELKNPDSKINFMTLVKRALESSIRLEMSMPDPESKHLQRVYELASKNKDFLLYEAIRGADALAHVPPALVQREADLRTDIAYYELLRYESERSDSTDDQLAARNYAAQVFALQRDYEALMRQFQKEAPAYFDAKYKIRTSTVRFVQDSVLAPGQSLLEYFVGDSATYVFMIRKDAFTVIDVKNDFTLKSSVEGMLHGLCGHFKDKSKIKSPDDLIRTANLYADNAAQFYQKWVQPVDSLLTRRVVIIPDGPIAYVPFDALLTKRPRVATRFESHEYWSKNRVISYCYSANLLHEMQREHLQTTAVAEVLVAAPFFDNKRHKFEKQAIAPAVGGVLLRDSLARLEHSGEEAKMVAGMFGTVPLLGRQADKASVLARIEQCKLVHLSTHGRANFQTGDYGYLGFSASDDPAVFEKMVRQGHL